MSHTAARIIRAQKSGVTQEPRVIPSRTKLGRAHASAAAALSYERSVSFRSVASARPLGAMEDVIRAFRERYR